MLIALIGIVAGLVIGVYAPITIPLSLSRYTAVAVLAIVDSLFGAIRADTDGDYDAGVFLSGLALNTLLAGIITYFGDRLGLELYLGVIVVFTLRMFRNVAAIRYHYWHRGQPEQGKAGRQSAAKSRSADQ